MNIDLKNILLGAVGSLVATLVLFLLSKLYKSGYKKDFEFSLDMAYTSIYQVENLLGYPNDYPLVIAQIDCLYRNAFDMYRSLTPLSLWSRPISKILIITILNDIIRSCEVSKFTTIGFSGEDEWEARLKRVEKVFYRYKYLDDSNVSTVRVQLDIIKNLLNKKGVCKSVKEAFGNKCDNLPYEDFAIDGFININSFKQKSNNVGIQKYCYKKDNFELLFQIIFGTNLIEPIIKRIKQIIKK